MKGIKKILNNMNYNTLKRNVLLSLFLFLSLVLIGNINFTKARYENSTMMHVKPDLAFFIVDVSSESGKIKLDGMVPRDEPYLYSFNVSNFRGTDKANVDLTYSIEIITTTNMPLEFKIYRDNGSDVNEVDSDTVTTNDDGVYFRHLLINDVNTMSYKQNETDVYILSVSFPSIYKNNSVDYAGIIDLVDIKINAEQVV